tara:strand:+ start:10685 stop:10912 length:228 start_codon:yes stop_codon:yes gene_type:complete
MKIETKKDIVEVIASEFRGFGGGKSSEFNPLSSALSDSPPVFALGVSVEDVVKRVLQLKRQADIEATWQFYANPK